jgi:aromatic-L-amino-acid/L-tryptophan decarboxylase
LSNQPEHNLDPQDWDEFRQLGHQMMDDMIDHLQSIREQPVWQPIPEEVVSKFDVPMPEDATPDSEVYQEFLDNILPYPVGNTHPRFWGWVMTTGTPQGMLAEMLTGAMSLQMGGLHSSGVYVEQQVIKWLTELMGFPDETSGILVSGCSMANLVCLTVARNDKATFDIRKEGLQNNQPRMTVYASAEVHSCHQKNTELLGLGSDSIRFISVNDDFEMRIDLLREAIEKDISEGYLPMCVVGTAGTVKTGAFDDLNAIADICVEHNIWFHVDGAFGSMVAYIDELSDLVHGMERADSLGFDMHKWMSLPFEAACALVKKGEVHYNAFTLTPDYLTHGTRGTAGAKTWFSDYGIQLSRSFRALKVWMAMKANGKQGFANVIRMNIEQTQYLADSVDRSPYLERTASVPLNIVCFRYIKHSMSPDDLNALNEELLLRLQEGGVAVVSNSTINGKYSLRMANVNHRSTYADFDLLVETVIQLGHELVQESKK